MYKHFFWDFDGTLFNSYPAIVEAFRQALLEQGVVEDREAIFAEAIVTITHAGEYFTQKYQLPADAFFARFKALQRELEPEMVKPYPHAVELVAEIVRKGGRNYLYTHRGLSAVDYMKGCGMNVFFTGYVTREDHFPPKPDPAALLFMLGQYRVNPQEALMTGDRAIDVLAGKNAGMDGCFFNSGGIAPVPEADFTIVDLNELRKYI